MTTDIPPAASAVRERDYRFALRESMYAERTAYERMRALVPDLALPMAQRRPLTGQQQEAIDEHARLRDEVEAMRRPHRLPGLGQQRDQSA